MVHQEEKKKKKSYKKTIPSLVLFYVITTITPLHLLNRYLSERTEPQTSINPTAFEDLFL